MMEKPRKYTQQEWDREVGWGEVPDEYAYDASEEEQPSDNTDDAYQRAMSGI